jgi:hypothetical protein
VSEAAHNPEFESLLLRALAPVDPPERLSERLEQTLSDLTDLAAEQLDSWEISSMRDPRNWVRPVAAAAIGTAAGAGLVVLRVRSQRGRHRAQAATDAEFVQRMLHAAGDEVRRLLRR